MKITFIVTTLLVACMAQGQILKVLAGTDLTIISGTIFKADSLILTPSENFIMSDNELTKSTTIIHTTPNPYISRVYQFTSTTNLFSGSVQVNYTDGAELNGIPEGSLTLNVHDGTSWHFFPATLRDGTNNFVLTDGLNAVSLNELTLADVLTPLPLVWISFTAAKQNKTAVLRWTTAREQNTKNFSVQHSTNDINWADIGTLPAASSTGNYSYVHTAPSTGINYYRILQTDMDNRSSYSNIRTLQFTVADEPFTILVNPVTNNMLAVQVNVAAAMALYAADGKLLWKEQVRPGTNYINVSRYAKGVYLLKANTSTKKVLIQ
ncbi:MAG: T9SS type A sorting domain-containing protein [Bacteroidota bacterium]